MGRRLARMLARHPARDQRQASSLTRDGLGGSALAGIDHDEHFHDIVIDPDQSVSPVARNAGDLTGCCRSAR